MQRRLFVLSLALILGASSLSGCVSLPCDYGGECEIDSGEILVEEIDPWLSTQFPGFDLEDVDGKNWTNNNFTGDVWVAYFSAVWCQHCETTFDAYDKAIPEDKFLAFNKEPREQYSDMGEWRNTTSERLERNITRPFIHAPNLSAELNVKGIPHAFFVDGNGTIIDYTYGVQNDFEILHQRFLDNGGVA